eukprot:Gregarina_sp_Poly_1__3218@NODE_1918_length_3083_cov_19_339191_g984_i2_p2_GENE_NODE_1918_length_3083_cov_19_339191_g984_i2NODE_1918_length_3083_cov_19_339191_g984_i2_p2_ORF_typecomplete_len103_score15_21VSNARE_C/PF12352_8/0_061BetR/PF08667_10/0_21BetR/PF08667_10/8_7e02Use1/PF09753_9/0_056DUF2951/PF11166_8/0_066Apolipoprotein/PF01442_18/0_068DUF3584/PF12128_8/0_074_NODE_1918_length_3083_cov_19_339191_g984_i223262634
MEVEQDWRLREIAKVAERLNETAQTINNELREQTVFLDEFEGEVEDQHGAINQVIKRMGVVLKTNSNPFSAYRHLSRASFTTTNLSMRLRNSCRFKIDVSSP